MDNRRYMIGDAAALVDVETHVLRYWEEELELAVPRNEMGHRYYTKENIDQFLRIKELKEQGYQLKSIKMILHGCSEHDLLLLEELNRSNGNSSRTTMDVGQVGPGGKMATDIVPSESSMSAHPTGSQGVASYEHRMEQFQALMGQIVREAMVENNKELSREVGEQVRDRVLKEMNYLMREQDEQEEARYRKLDEAIRNIHKKRKKEKKIFSKKVAPQPKQA